MTKQSDQPTTPIPFPSPRSDDAVAWLQQFHPGGPWHLVAIDDSHSTGGTLTDANTAARWIKSYQGKANLYFHVNQLAGAPHRQQATKQEVTAALYLHTDVDDPSVAALTMLREYTPPPTAIVFSGGGYQAFWKLAEPTTDLAAAEARNQAIAAAISPSSAKTSTPPATTISTETQRIALIIGSSHSSK